MGSADSTLRLADGTNQQVGKLQLPGLPHPEKLWGVSDETFVFISHTGRDGIKELIAEPTYWFLKNVLCVKAFVDSCSMEAGSIILQEITEAAYKCTHAVVILSPTFREREFCVRELNTFMHRMFCLKDGIRVVPALWKVVNAEGYHDHVNGLCWIPHEPLDEVSYLIHTLWPKLCSILQGSNHIPSTRQMEEYLLTYVEENRRSLPSPLFDFAVEKVGQHPPYLFGTDDGSANEPLVSGVMFSGCYMDHNPDWNDFVLERKNHIEQNLRYLLRYGTLTYGVAEVTQERQMISGGVSRAVARLECEIEVRHDLARNQLREVRRVTRNIVSLLREAGTTEEQLRCMMIGAVWEGSLCMLLEAPHGTLEMLFNLLTKSHNKLPIDKNSEEFPDKAELVGLMPAFVVRGAWGDFVPYFRNEGLALVSTDGINLLCPATPRLRGDLLCGGLSYDQWDSSQWTLPLISTLRSIPTVLPSVLAEALPHRDVRALVHSACFDGDVRKFFFIKVVNLTQSHEIEVTHIWFEAMTGEKLHVMNDERCLPTRLRLEETYETWIACDDLPDGPEPETKFRVMLSNGEVVESELNKNVPSEGYVAGKGNQPS